MQKLWVTRVVWVLAIFLCMAVFAMAHGASALFLEKATALVQKDFLGQEVRLSLDYPERLQHLKGHEEIIDYKNLGQGRVQFRLVGDEKPITAKVDILIAVPVLSKPVSSASVIEESDLVLQKMPASQINGSPILKAQDLIGKKPKGKVIPAMTTIQAGDIEAPIVIKRDSLVRLFYSVGTLELTAQVKALKDGAAGQRITFETTGKIKKQIDAVVVDSNRAEVRA